LGRWFVIGYEGRRDGIDYWRCMCRLHGVEKIVARRDLFGRRNNPAWPFCRCRNTPDDLTDGIIGLWNVLGPAPDSSSARLVWRCRCLCGTERVIPQRELGWNGWKPHSMSCGCQPHDEVLAQWGAKWVRALAGRDPAKLWQEALRQDMKRRHDGKWTGEMERALCALQPTCVVCGSTANLGTDHVRPLSKGCGLAPGNAVRLCRTCNTDKGNRDLAQLPPNVAEKIREAAAQFKLFWDSRPST
jgi:5-methylcytosine-specific restriction endonuclease McrA